MMPAPEKPTTPSDKTPSPETDRHQPEKPTSDNDDDDSAGIGRSYECTFCKRGFTNAQALGGHMNIHRKDKAKAKAKQKFAATATNHQDHHCSSTKSNEIYTNNLRYNYPILPISHHQDQKAAYYYMPGGGQVNYQVYLPSPNPNSQIGNFGLQPVLRPADGSVDRPNLSLRIGQSEPDEDRGKNKEGNDVDLELRLGHDP